MAKVGRFVTDPEAESYGQIVLDSGEKLMVSHDQRGFGGGSATVQELRWWGFASGDTLLRCDLQSAEGQRILAHLAGGPPGGRAGDAARGIRREPERLPVPERGEGEVQGPRVGTASSRGVAGP